MDTAPGNLTERAAGTRPDTVVVAGFLGAGRSHVARLLTGDPPPAGPGDLSFADRAAGTAATGVRVIEASPLRDPALAAPPGALVVTVIDSVNVAACLADPDHGPLVADQIRAADVIVLNRGEIVDPAGARAAIAGLSGAPMIDLREAPDPAAAILTASPGTGRRAAEPRDLTRAFAVWRYDGPVVLTPEAAEALLAARPKGVYRITGIVAGPDGGLAVDVFGRARRGFVTKATGATQLAAIGPVGRFVPRDMDLAFAEAVSAAAYARGMIACR